jgi:hypothetical protein
MKNVYTTTLRLNLNIADDRRAWEYLQRMDKQKYRSINKAIIMALNDYFDRQERMLHDSYLETREKEDVFLRRVLDTITQGMNAAASMGGLLQLLQGASPQTSMPDTERDDAMDAALDFADSF